VKNQFWIFSSIIFILFSLLISSCKRINEATEIGQDLIPPVDNITTFQTFLDVETNNVSMLNDTAEMNPTDPVAIGNITSDPEFGSTNASAYFSISSNTYGANPFIHRDSVVQIDSVVLSLDYVAHYGDTNSTQTFRVFEIDQNSGFTDTALYRYNRPEFATANELGSKTFQVNSLNDTITLVRRTDTVREANVLRIRLDNSIGTRFSQYDTLNNSNGGFRNDSIFKKLFRGIAIKADQGVGNALVYFNLNNNNKTRLVVYFQGRNGKADTLAAAFTHVTLLPNGPLRTNPANFINGQANIIKREPAGAWATYLFNGSAIDDKLYIQSEPGSIGAIKIPGLDTLQNSIIHRAELIVTKIPSALENIFTPPIRLFLDRINNNGDSAFVLDKDLIQGNDFNYSVFGGSLGADNIYRFNISRYVQDIVTLGRPNHTLRLHAPYRASLWFPSSTPEKFPIPFLDFIAKGRVVVAGGNYAEPEKRMRLRIVYSKI
jgi:hypothetical protein